MSSPEAPEQSCRSREGRVFPDELIFRHARASVELGPSHSDPTTTNQQPDFNNNYIIPPPQEIRHTNLIVQNENRRTDAAPSGGDQDQCHLRSDPLQEVARLRHQLDASHRSFREERRKLLLKINELENDLEQFSERREREDDRQNQNVRELDDKAQQVSEELTKALLKNVLLVEETAALKSTQLSLSSRMSSLEEQLQRLDAPNQENAKMVLIRLEKREASLKNQALRLAQLESYYTRELNLLSMAGGRGPIPELQTQESSIIQIHPQLSPQQTTIHLPHFVPRQIETVEQIPQPQQYRSIPEPAPGRNSYSELYYKAITDKAINLIQREAGNCNALIQKFGKHGSHTSFPTTNAPKVKAKARAPCSSIPLDVSSSSDVELEQSTRSKKIFNGENVKPQQQRVIRDEEEEEILRLLFFKF